MKNFTLALLATSLLAGCASSPEKSSFIRLESSMSQTQMACLYDGLLEKNRQDAIDAVTRDIQNEGALSTATLNTYPDIGLLTRSCA